MPELIEELTEKIVSAVVAMWGLLTGIPRYELQEARERTPDLRRALILNQVRRITPIDHGCDRY